MQEVTAGFEVFVKLLTCLKNVNISYEYAKENDGSITCWTKTPHLIENAPTLTEGLNCLLKSLRERANDYISDFNYWIKGCPEELPYIMKIILSNNEELESCLHGKN